MEILELEQLQRQATHYFERFAAGFSQRFPEDVVRQLLRTDGYDGWAVGLYLLSTLRKEEIATLFFDDGSTYKAISKLIASEQLNLEMRVQQEFELAESPDDEPIDRMWQMPGKLRELVASEWKNLPKITNLYSSASDPELIEQSDDVAIIIHGTWATSNAWWQPNSGSFWKYIKQFWPHLYSGSSPFWWSGANWNSTRWSAAHDLIRWVKHNQVKSLDIIAHSHGGNVCLLAAQLGLKINRLILLGTPIRTQYMLNLSNIGSIRNIFSIGDLVQIPGSLPHRRGEGRTLSDSSKVVNYRARKNDRNWNPGHTNLHEETTWKASGLEPLLS